MDKNRISGAADKAKGAVKESVGKVTGNDRLRAEGTTDKIKGNVKEAAGKTADAARKVVDIASGTVRKATR